MARAGIFFRELVTEIVPAQLFGDGQRGAAAGKGIEHGFARLGARENNAAQQLLRHLAAVPTLAFLERAVDAGEVPGPSGLGRENLRPEAVSPGLRKSRSFREGPSGVSSSGLAISPVSPDWL